MENYILQGVRKPSLYSINRSRNPGCYDHIDETTGCCFPAWSSRRITPFFVASTIDLSQSEYISLIGTSRESEDGDRH